MYVKFDEVKLEYKMDGIIPDVLIYVNGRPLLIEITVTHHTDKPKISKIKEFGISCIEIDLSGINRNITPEELKDIIIHQIDLKNGYIMKRHIFIKNKLIHMQSKKIFITEDFLIMMWFIVLSLQ